MAARRSTLTKKKTVSKTARSGAASTTVDQAAADSAVADPAQTEPVDASPGLEPKADLPNGLEIGMQIRVEGERELFHVVGVAADGSITCIGEQYHHFRAFRPDWCWPAFSRTKSGIKKKVPMPAHVRGKRDEWRERHGLARANRCGDERPIVGEDDFMDLEVASA